MTADPKPQRATTREHLIERLQEFHRDACKPADGSRDTVSGYWVRTELEKLLDLASRLPSPPAASECRVAHEATEAMLSSACSEENAFDYLDDRPSDYERYTLLYRAMERARVAQAAPAEPVDWVGRKMQDPVFAANVEKLRRHAAEHADTTKETKR